MKRRLALLGLVVLIVALAWLVRGQEREPAVDIRNDVGHAARENARDPASAPALLEAGSDPEGAPERQPVELDEAARDPSTSQGPAPTRGRGLVSGRVVAEGTGLPIAGATLTLLDDPPLSSRSAASGPSGEFSFAGVTPGTWSLYAEAYGWAPQAVRIVVGEPDPEEIVLALTARPVVIVRLLGDDGAPLSRAFGDTPLRVAELALVESGRPLGVERSPGEGDDARPVGPDGSVRRSDHAVFESDWFRGRPEPDPLDTPIELGDPLPRHLSLCRGREVLAEVVVASPPPEIVELVVPLARLSISRTEVRLRLVAAGGGAPILGARAGLFAPGAAGQPLHVADEQGFVRIEGNFAGARWLVATAPEHQWLQREVVVPVGGAEVDLGTFALTRAARIRGRVVGAATACMDVTAYPLERFEETRAMRGSFGGSSAPPDSRWELRGLGREKHVLRLANAQWAALPVVVDTSAGNVEEVEIRAEPGTEVRFELDEPRADGLLRIETSDRLPVTERPIAGERELPVRLVPGRYVWRIDAADEPEAWRELEVGTRDLAVPAGG